MTPPAQTVWPGRQAAGYEDAAARLIAARAVQRVYEKDPALWAGDDVQKEQVRNRLGWLDIPGVMASRVAELARVLEDVRASGLTRGVLLGMGGSGLFTEVCRALLGVGQGGIDLALLDTTDPTAIDQLRRRCPLQELLVVVSSKSGTTAEVAMLSRFFYDVLKSGVSDPGAHCLAVTDDATPLAVQAEVWKFRRIIALGPQTGADVGGRFSALTYFGLVPAALLGLDIAKLLERAVDALGRCGPKAAGQNPAAELAALLAACAHAGADKLSLVCPPELSAFGLWIEQLIAESTGKNGQGLVPVVGEPLRTTVRCGDDRVYVALQVGGTVDSQLEPRLQALRDAGHPLVRIEWRDRYDVGGEVVKWSVATALLGHLLGVNPFDEPNVQEAKDQTRALLSDYARTGAFPQEEPLIREGALAVYGNGGTPKPATVREALLGWLRALRPRDYLAVLSFLPQTVAVEAGLHELRTRLAERLPNATLLQWGPRYLHSTGQLFKGGPDTGMFLLLTADDPIDLSIPAEPLSFSVLKQAQALGDVAALRQRGRRVLRIHLGPRPDEALKRLAQVVEEAALVMADQTR